MTSRSESFTREVLPAEPPRESAPATESRSGGPGGRFVWNVTLGIAAAAYLALVLFDDVESPLLSLALIVLVAHELVRSRRHRF